MNNQNNPPMASLCRLMEELNNSNIHYCQWKSNIRIEEALRGETDLDLLVDPWDMVTFQMILSRHGVKQFEPPPGREYPGITSYLGFDAESGRLYHLHVHNLLVLGQQYVKEYHLPVEKDFLEDVRLIHGVKVPQVETELIILCLRTLLKYRDRDGIKRMIGYRGAPMHLWICGLPPQSSKEIQWLYKQTSMERIQEQLHCWEGIVPGKTVMEFLQAVLNGELPGYQALRLRSEVRRALSRYQRGTGHLYKFQYFREDWRRKRYIHILTPRFANKMLRPQGGVRIAFVGADGAGKSTIINQIKDWLSWRLGVRVYYMGTSQPSWLTKMVKEFTYMSNVFNKACTRLFGKASLPDRLANRLTVFIENVKFLSEGWDKFRRYRASMENAQAGMVVLYDRYPIENSLVDNRPMDGSRIAVSMKGKPAGLTRILSGIEETWYHQMTLPEHLIALQVSPSVSLSRKPARSKELIEEKVRAVEELASQHAEAAVVQADRPLEQVLLQVKFMIWGYL